MYTLRHFLMGSLIVATLGCADSGPARYPVEGTVSFRGTPLESGAIQFEPVTGHGQSGGAPIINGNFQVPAEKGLLAGQYHVRIYSGTTGVAPSEPPGPGVPIAAEHIPPRYNTQSTLNAEVGPHRNNKLEFILD
ncbi:MAG: hypothetical protein AB7K24_14455 [Gemmataceae bacterium]